MKLSDIQRDQLSALAGEQEISGISPEYGARINAELRFPLPESYLEFLSICNGCEIDGIRFCGDGSSEFELISSASEMSEFISEIARQEVYPLACTWGGDWICFDLRKKSANGEYPILLWEHEECEEEDDEAQPWTELAADFPTYLSSLLEAEGD